MKNKHKFVCLLITGLVNSFFAKSQSFSGYLPSADSLSVKSLFAKQTRQSAFEENKGQVTGVDANHVTYFYKTGNLSMFLLKTGIAYQFNKTTYPEGYKSSDKFNRANERKIREQLEMGIQTESYRMDVILIDANPNAVIITEGKSKDYINYYNHDALDVHNFSKITYQDIYPNIDWVLYKQGENIKYDFVVRPGGNPSKIRLQTRNVEHEQLKMDGRMILHNRIGEIIEETPISFQDGKEIGTKFAYNNGYYCFLIDDYDPSKKLIIDPYVEWATYYGGNSDDGSASCATFNSDVYIVGSARSTNNIAAGGYQNTFGGGINDALLVKFNSLGARLWATYYGGGDWDSGESCSIDSIGNVYMSGFTRSASGISSSGFQNAYGGDYDGFLVKFDSAGIRQWGTYYGGSGADYGHVCLTDKYGSVYLAGETTSTGLAYNGFQNTIGGNRDAYLVKFNSAGTRLWATYYGGVSWDSGETGAIDNSGFVYMAGNTADTTINSSLSTAGASQSVSAGLTDGFLVKFDTGGVRQWATYYGGTLHDQVYGCIVDAMHNIYMVGNTNSTSGIALNGHQNTNGGFYDGFIVKYNSNGVRQWGSYYGGTDYDVINSCVVNDAGSVYLTGWTDSDTGIASPGYQNTNAVGADAFVSKFNSAGVRQWSRYYGSETYDDGFGCALDNTGAIYISGKTGSLTNIAQGGFQNTQGGGYASDAMLIKFRDTCIQIGIDQQPMSESTCSNDTIRFIVGSVNSTQYQWQVNMGNGYVNVTNGINYNGATNDTLLVYPNASFNGWVYRCVASSSNSCSQIVSNDATLNVYQTLVPVFSLPDTICLGATAPQLPLISVNNINGTWNPSTINTVSSGSYIFTPISIPGQCLGSYTLNLIVSPNITPTFNINTDVCVGDVVPFLPNTSLEGITGIWSPSSINNTSSGTYSFSPAPGQCAIPITLNVTVHNPSNSIDTKTVCSDDSPYVWNGISNAINGTVYNTTTIYGCDSTVTLSLNISLPPTTIIFDTSACGSIFYNGNEYTHSTTVTSIIPNTFGCDSIVKIANLTIYPNTPLLKIIDTLGCDEVLFEGNTYIANSILTDTFHNVLGCDSLVRTVKVTVVHFELNLNVFPEDPYVGEKISLNSSANSDNYAVISWFPYSLFPNQENLSYSIIADKDGVISISGMDSHGCTDTALVSYTVKPLNYGIFIPNAFTPNNDGNNDVFSPRLYMTRAYVIKSFKIFDRWGKLVYGTYNSVDANWDGNYNNHKSADIGTYTYNIVVEFVDGKTMPIKGDVILLR